MKTERKLWKEIVYHLLVLFGAVVMVYPLLWMVFSSFKPTDMVLPTSNELLPREWTLRNYIQGWQGFMGYSFATFFANSFFISLASTFGTLFSSALVAYALQRLQFRGRDSVRPGAVHDDAAGADPDDPQFAWYRHLNWVGTYYPMILPYFFAVQGFFVYLIMNFIGGIPKDLDEAAKIDGCSYYVTFFRIILPLIVPALVTSAIFSFIWRWDDYLSALLYVKKAKHAAHLPLALQLFNDPSSGNHRISGPRWPWPRCPSSPPPSSS